LQTKYLVIKLIVSKTPEVSELVFQQFKLFSATVVKLFCLTGV